MNDQQNPSQEIQINIELDEKMAEGIYSNFAIINHSPAEVIIDFTKILPGVQKAKVGARIVMTPQHAKMLLQALTGNLATYEATYGQIKLHGSTQSQMGFQPADKNTLS